MGIVDRFRKRKAQGEPKFNVGDRVRLLDEEGQPNEDYPEGIITMIKGIHGKTDQWFYGVEFDGVESEVMESELASSDTPTPEQLEQWMREGRITKAELEKEHERRWDLNSLPEGLGEPSIIKQGMIAEGEDGYARIREQDGKYTMTAKHFPSHDEAETEISKEIFETLWPSVDKQQVKKRYTYHAGDDHDWIIDELDDGSIVAEVETSRKNGAVTVPEEFDVKAEREYD